MRNMTILDSVDYDHSKNLHSLEGPRAALPLLVEPGAVNSVLDIGCGKGTWLKAAIENGAKLVVGVDGIEIPHTELLFPPENFHICDLRKPLDLHQHFDLVLCLEVAEHLEKQYAEQFVKSIAIHSDTILFSAACPGQSGQHHINCQWPEYWQALFNKEGYACTDAPRWKIWRDTRIEPWYRQNIFLAVRDYELAGKEPRIFSTIHPDYLLQRMAGRLREEGKSSTLQLVSDGSMSIEWYLWIFVRAIFKKIGRRIFRYKLCL
jgi:SAM-dependent methyltransferase